MAASSWADPGLVFPNMRGKIRRRDTMMRSLRRFLEEAGLPVEVRFHDLRHTAGTLALRKGMPLYAVSKMLGYSDPAMTLRISSMSASLVIIGVSTIDPDPSRVSVRAPVGRHHGRDNERRRLTGTIPEARKGPIVHTPLL
jgi:hypothetical protein